MPGVQHYVRIKYHTKKDLILLLDFEKAFDSLEWHYIKKVLQKYNFGETFKNWFKTLYSGACSCVINNGIFSDFFLIRERVPSR